jgi:hypothetical protein
MLPGAAPGLERIEAVKLIASQPVWIQFVLFILLKDLLEWVGHNF